MRESLLTILVFKIVATSLGRGFGAAGGVFTPALFEGFAKAASGAWLKYAMRFLAISGKGWHVYP